MTVWSGSRGRSLRVVDRVHREGVLGREVPVQDRVVEGVRLLAEDDGIGVGLGEVVGDDPSASRVGHVTRSPVLLHDLTRGERAEARVMTSAHLTQEVEDGVVDRPGMGVTVPHGRRCLHTAPTSPVHGVRRRTGGGVPAAMPALVTWPPADPSRVQA